MNRKIIIISGILVALLLASFFITKYQFGNNLKEFKNDIQNIEANSLADFKKVDDKLRIELESANLKVFELYRTNFNQNKAVQKRDTTYSLLFLSETVPYKTANKDYLKCLKDKSFLDLANAVTQKTLNSKEWVFENKHGDSYLKWYPQFESTKLVTKSKMEEQCSRFFPDAYEIFINKPAWEDFDKFLKAYKNDMKAAKVSSARAESKYNARVQSTKRQLSYSIIDYFENKLSQNSSELLYTQTEKKEYNSTSLGLIEYELKEKNFNQERFNSITEDTFEEQWKTNSLRTGAAPYSNCFGSYAYCSDYSCSKIKVVTGGSGDVLVSIKDSNGDVIRHAYINGGDSYTFNLANGSYQVFFYSGSGWNPNKPMNSSSCSTLKGGFVNDESVTKDSYINIYSQIMTYELILQRDGNLRTQPSSKDEAF